MLIGCHLSGAEGYLRMGREILEMGGNTFQFFTRNPRGGSAKRRDPDDERAFLELAAEKGIGTIVAHAPYTLNLCSADERIREFARRTMADDLERLEALPGNLYNFHPGCHVGQGVENGIRMITDALNAILRHDMRTTVLLETMAGKGSEIGSRFEELKAIMDGVVCAERLGVCLDTCHVHDAGYDIKNDPEAVLEELDRVTGLKALKAVHINDSKNTRGARKDRHEKIGSGELGTDALVRWMKLPELRELPFILETPNDTEGYAEEIRLLRERCA